MNEKAKEKSPGQVFSADPEKELEDKLSAHPEDDDLKVDVGSDESMDASDPSSVTRPGRKDEPAPSSGYPE